MGVYISGVTKSQLMKVIINSTEFMPDDFEVIEVKVPHGNLVDIDAVVDDYSDGLYTEIPNDHIDKINVVIEAETE